MKIFIIFPKDSEALFDKNSNRTFGGASVQMYNIAKELYKYKDIETFSIIPDYTNIEFDDYDKFNLVKLYNEKDNAIVKFFNFIKYTLITKPEVIIQHGLMTESCILAFICWILKIKFIFMFAHDVEVKGLRQADQSRVLLFFLLRKFAYIIITQNKYQHDTLIHEYGCENIIIYNGFEIKKRNIVKNKKNYILWVARCDSWKQPEVFLQLVKNNPDLKFCMICPQSQDESFFNNIRKQALMIKNVTFINFVPYNEIDKFFEHALIFVNTSLYEGFPQTFIQATMNGVPIVTLHVNPENFLDTFQCGYCCNGDVELLNNKIKELTGDRKKYKILSDNAYKYAIENHNIDLNVKKIIGLLQ